MIKTAPHSTLSPQMWCITKIIKDWFARTQIYCQEFVNLSNAKKFNLICFRRICFPRLIYCDQKALLLLNVIEDYFLGVHIRLYQLDTRFVSLQNHLAFPQNSHECALTLTDLWNTKLLFDLSYKFIDGSFAFSCG